MDTIISFLTNLLAWVVRIVEQVLITLLELFFALIDPLLIPLVELVPDMSSYWGDFDTIRPYISFANLFVSWDVGFTLLGCYFLYIAIMIVIKLTIKLFVPTVG